MNEAEKLDALKKINDYYGSSFSTDHILLRKEEKDGLKIFIYSGSLTPKIQIEWMGLHLATLGGEVLLSIEGAQMIGKTARKTIEITRNDADDLMKGLDLKYAGELLGFVILKQAANIIGIGKAEEGKIINTLPHSRRVVRFKKE